MRRSAAWLIGIAAALVLFGFAAWKFADFVADDEFPELRPQPNAPALVAQSGEVVELSQDSGFEPGVQLAPPSARNDERGARLGVPAMIRLRGHVQDADGGFIIGMHVAREDEPDATLAITDSTGGFELDIPNALGALVATDHDWVTVKKIALPLPEGARYDFIVVFPTMELEGIVHDAEANPLRGARVRIDVPPERLARVQGPIDAGSIPARVTTTGDDGRFSLRDVPWVERGDLVVELEGYLPASKPFRTWSRLGLDIELLRKDDPRLRIEGTVVFADGSPAPRAKVRLGESVTTAEETGAFILEFKRSDAQSPLTAESKGFQPAVIEREDWIAETSEEDRRSIRLVLGEPLHSIHGRVLLADGSPGRGWVVGLAEAPGDGPWRTGFRMTDATLAEGTFHFAGVPDTVCELRSWSKTDLSSTDAIRIRPSGEEVVLRARTDEKRIDIRGRVTGRDDRGIANVRVTLSLVLQDTPWGETVLGPSTTTRFDGTFLFSSAPYSGVCFEISGDDVEPFTFNPLSSEASRVALRDGRPVEIVARRRCQLELAGSRQPDGPDEAAVSDGFGNAVDIRVLGDGDAMNRRSVSVPPGSIVRIAVGESAKRLVIYRKGVAVDTIPIEGSPSELRRLQLP